MWQFIANNNKHQYTISKILIEFQMNVFAVVAPVYAHTHTNRLSFTAIHFIHLAFLRSLINSNTTSITPNPCSSWTGENLSGFTTASFCFKEFFRRFPHNFKMDWVVWVLRGTICCRCWACNNFVWCISSFMQAHVRHRDGSIEK